MKVTKEFEKLENSSVKLTVTVGKTDVAENYTKTLTKYSKELQLPGFRKGKVPVSVLERKYGKAIKNEVAGTLMDQALQIIFEELDKDKSDMRPLAYSQPIIDEIPDLDVTSNFTFTVQYDVMPLVKVEDFSGIEVKEAQVEIKEDDLKEELEAIRERNAMVIDKKDSDSAAKGDIVTIDYCELDEKGEELDGSKREGFVFTIGTGENIYKIDDEIIGMKKDETKRISKTFPQDFADKELAGKTKEISVKVSALKVRQLPDLDDELAQDVNEKYKTLDDLKNDIKKNMQTNLSKRIREMKINSMLEQLIEKYPVTIPESMLRIELEQRWRMMAQQFQCSVEQLEKFMTSSGQKKEDLLKEWSSDAEKNLKSRVIIESLLKEKTYEVSDEEIEAEYERIAQNAGMSVEDVKKHYAQDARAKEYITDEIKEQKLYDEMFSKIKISKGEKLSFAELFKRN
ncbi:MAG: trigger factor [Treponemataceae bacterium]